MLTIRLKYIALYISISLIFLQISKFNTNFDEQGSFDFGLAPRTNDHFISKRIFRIKIIDYALKCPFVTKTLLLVLQKASFLPFLLPFINAKIKFQTKIFDIRCSSAYIKRTISIFKD